MIGEVSWDPKKKTMVGLSAFNPLCPWLTYIQTVFRKMRVIAKPYHSS
jgi:hypothetical protein